jgi:hypothetical protein
MIRVRMREEDAAYMRAAPNHVLQVFQEEFLFLRVLASGVYYVQVAVAYHHTGGVGSRGQSMDPHGDERYSAAQLIALGKPFAQAWRTL